MTQDSTNTREHYRELNRDIDQMFMDIGRHDRKLEEWGEGIDRILREADTALSRVSDDRGNTVCETSEKN